MNTALRTENQRLRDELARLQGGSGKPDIRPPVARSATDHSSETERRVRTPRGQRRTITTRPVTRIVRCTVDPTRLPLGAVRHGTVTRHVQELTLTADTIRFVRDVWRDPTTGATSTAPLPPGYHGAFGPQVRALILALGHGANVSQPALLTFLTDAGIAIGAGTLARWLADAGGQWQAEARAIPHAGLASGSWHATAMTSTRVDGQNHTCHVLGNACFSSYHTRPGGTRQDVLAVLWGQTPVFRLDDDALLWLAATTCPQHIVTRLPAALPWATDLIAAELATHLATAGLALPPDPQRQVHDALGICAYHAQTTVPIVRTLLTNDAAVYHPITDVHARCWVHAGRHLATLAPVVP